MEVWKLPVVAESAGCFVLITEESDWNVALPFFGGDTEKSIKIPPSSKNESLIRWSPNNIRSHSKGLQLGNIVWGISSFNNKQDAEISIRCRMKSWCEVSIVINLCTSFHTATFPYKIGGGRESEFGVVLYLFWLNVPFFVLYPLWGPVCNVGFVWASWSRLEFCLRLPISRRV